MCCNRECSLLTVVEEQNQQTAVFSEDRRTSTKNANVSTADATLGDVDERCSRRLFEPFHVATSPGDAAGTDQRNVLSRLHPEPRSVKTTDDIPTFAAAADTSPSLLQTRG